ncbi:GGDEF domain-containing protein [Methylobacterium gossipiicola]|uniref:diguanylate cyclase n=1 Tax=Methylobacterium gossipiicola TaxID=582675 RepID=A0A1I2TA76_9HYPH|nr:GGDEF domain-containing protein [Methylobacterium gossipiicola]SFG60137.1 diguanylate cyclase (GGDEF) domain-containing protein [Methylobacterium gossipiicola]
MYPPPLNPALRWIAEIGADLPEAVQRRLRSGFYTSVVPLVVGSFNTTAVALVAFLRSGHPAFAAIALADLLLLGLRVRLLRSVNTSSGPIFATGLLWAALHGLMIALVVTSADVAMSIVALASGLGAAGGIIGRNFAAPRYAMAQVLLIDLGYKISFCLGNPEFLPLILLQTAIFILMNRAILKQQRTFAIQAILGEAESRRQSVTDPLTGLLNRRGLEDAFEARDGTTRNRVLFYLDLDGFKQVNDRLGHAVGDALLCDVGRRLCETVGPDETICRLGGDEFLLLTGPRDDREAGRHAARIITAIAAPYHIDASVYARIGVSIGIARENAAGDGSLAELMQRADKALYAAKTAGRGCYILHGADAAASPADRIGHAA